ncbi:transcriptional regulator [Sanguibacteroides justesenii]|nr:transcriptional regulator [Sanguibacteroides justesenii]
MLIELHDEGKNRNDFQSIISISKQSTDTESITQRIEILVQYFAEGNNSKFASLVGTSEANIRNYITGTQPKFEFLSAVAMKFKINYDWLLTGRGRMLCDDNVEKNDKLKIGSNSHQETYLAEKETQERVLVAESKQTYNTGLTQIPIVDIAVAAGTGYYNLDNMEVIDTISLPESMIKTGVQYLCVRVKGESMAPTLLDSSFLVIRLLTRAEWEYLPDEQIYVVSDVEGKSYVKRVKNRLKKGFIVCMSDNPDKAYYPNFNLPNDEINTIWHAEWYISAKMPNIHQSYYNKVSELEDDIADIKNELGMIRRQLGAGN